MRALTLQILILLGLSLHGQTCLDSLSVLSTLDSTERKIYFTVDEMPKAEDEAILLNTIVNEIDLSELTCCPIYVWFGFIVEADGTLSNIKICPQYMSCNSPDEIEANNIKLIPAYEKFFNKIEFVSGKKNGKPVAVVYTSRVHYECK